jgi:phage tail sheath protein FI
MPVTPTYPGVYIEELPSPVHTIAGVATSIAAFVGYTARGIDNRAQSILSFSDYERLFGGIAPDSELSYAVQHFFQNGGAQGYVVRVPRTGAADAQVVFSNLRFSALSSGAWANGTLVIDVDVNGVNSAADATSFNLTITNLEDGTVESFPAVSLSSARSNYVLAVVNDPDTGSQLVNVATAGALPVTAPEITGTVGTAVTPATVNTTIGGAAASTVATGDFGMQLSVSAPAPAPAPLPLNIKVFAQNGPIPQTVAGLASQLERTVNAALAVQWPGASVRCSAVAAGTPGTQRIAVSAFFPGQYDAILSFAAPAAPLGNAAAVLGLVAPAVANVAHYTLGTTHVRGGQTAAAAGTDGTALPGTAGLIGDEISFTGIYALRKVDLFNILCIPDATRASAGNPSALDPTVDPNSIYSAAITLCQQMRAMLLVDAPPNVNTVAAAVDWKSSGLGVHQENGAAYFPRLRLPDPANDYQLRTFAPCGVVAGLYSRIDSARGVWKAPAGTEATLTGVRGVVYKLSDPENGSLNPLGLNCARIFPVYGPVMWGARTLVGSDAEGSQWKYVPVRRIALYIEESLYRGTKWAVFEPNDEPLWSQLRLNIGAFMHDLFRRGAFQGQTPAEAYLVKCDKDTTTQNDIDRGIVNILVGFAPLKPAEFVVIQIQQLAGQLQT